MIDTTISRRQFVQGLAALSVPLVSSGVSLAAAPKRMDLSVSETPFNFTGKNVTGVTIGGTLPAPVLRWREGDEVNIRVHNRLSEMSAIHWHGIILPSNMDGVPRLSFAGIPPGGYYDYRFKLRQSGTYWYHSHAAFQEQRGVYGAIVVDPAEGDPFNVDREHVVLLSDWSDEHPADIFATLKKNAHIYNRNRRSIRDIARDLSEQGLSGTVADRQMWNRMRMEDADLVDVTGYTYTYLMNGATPDQGWVGTFKPGERIRLRLINASAMSIFDLRIPGLKMQVVSADGQPVEPVSVDELRLTPAETVDVIVTPNGNEAYTIFAQSIDRSGYARGTLTPDARLQAAVPDMDPVPRLQHRDMGMAHEMPVGDARQHHHHHHQHQHGKKSKNTAEEPLQHAPEEYGPGVDMRAEAVSYRLDDPGVGLRDNGRRVLTYADLRRRGPSMSMREPDREIELHLTGNMRRYQWSFNGVRYKDAEVMHWRHGERVRVTLVNDTMMTHPIHLHGMWSELETGDLRHLPAKHTVAVQPGSKISYRVSADVPGRWAYHCHMLYHMMGMFREVRVS